MECKNQEPKSSINSNMIKLIACISMVIDHSTYLFVPPKADPGIMGENPWYLLGRSLGRPAFILLAFLLVEGFFYSKNIKAYMSRLFITALISEPAFDLMNGDLNLNHFLDHQNVLFQFTLGLFVICLLEAVKLKYFLSSKLYYNFFSVIICIAGGSLAYYMRLDYGITGISLILIFYFLHDVKKSILAAAVIIWSIGVIFLNSMLEWAGLPALVLIFLYNYDRGKKNLKWLFYIFYPVHMLILVLIKYLVC